MFITSGWYISDYKPNSTLCRQQGPLFQAHDNDLFDCLKVTLSKTLVSV